MGAERWGDGPAWGECAGSVGRRECCGGRGGVGEYAAGGGGEGA